MDDAEDPADDAPGSDNLEWVAGLAEHCRSGPEEQNGSGGFQSFGRIPILPS